MDKLEKVEKLRERANVSYEDARTALEENDWDLLDAMVALEKSGRTKISGQQNYSTSYDQQTEYIPVLEKVKEQQEKQPRPGRTIGEWFRKFIRFCRDNTFCISYHDKNVVRLPLLAAVLILFFTWRVSVPVMLVAMLFTVRYSFEGKDDLEKANAFMESAGNVAESLKDGLMKSGSQKSGNTSDSAAADNVSESADAKSASDSDMAENS